MVAFAPDQQGNEAASLDTTNDELYEDKYTLMRSNLILYVILACVHTYAMCMYTYYELWWIMMNYTVYYTSIARFTTTILTQIVSDRAD